MSLFFYFNPDLTVSACQHLKQNFKQTNNTKLDRYFQKLITKLDQLLEF